MPTIAFSKNIRTHVDVDRTAVAGKTVREALDSVLETQPKLGSYLLDDAGGVRKHVAIFINGESIRDREKLSDAVAESDEIFVMQALSGG
ncbi:MAG: MoaD/ThiS family protein [Verrucomicrobiales bacterium]|nr:MoaD/ThiS family protein [Verrucomicrobiales bacterium]